MSTDGVLRGAQDKIRGVKLEAGEGGPTRHWLAKRPCSPLPLDAKKNNIKKTPDVQRSAEGGQRTRTTNTALSKTKDPHRRQPGNWARDVPAPGGGEAPTSHQHHGPSPLALFSKRAPPPTTVGGQTAIETAGNKQAVRGEPRMLAGVIKRRTGRALRRPWRRRGERLDRGPRTWHSCVQQWPWFLDAGASGLYPGQEDPQGRLCPFWA